MTMTPIMVVRVMNYLHGEFSKKIKTAAGEQKLMMQRGLDCIKQGKVHVKVSPFDERLVFDATQK